MYIYREQGQFHISLLAGIEANAENFDRLGWSTLPQACEHKGKTK